MLACVWKCTTLQWLSSTMFSSHVTYIYSLPSPSVLPPPPYPAMFGATLRSEGTWRWYLRSVPSGHEEGTRTWPLRTVHKGDNRLPNGLPADSTRL